MKIAIMQPTYLPWLGYFDLIAEVDCFVLLDDVQFDRRSWQQRNRIKTADGLQWLTVPVKKKGRSEQIIRDVEVITDGRDFPEKHIQAIEVNYSAAPFFDTYFAPFCEQLEIGASSGKLAHLNRLLIEWMAAEFEIATPLLSSSELGCEGRKSERLANICHRLEAEVYISPIGSSQYLREDLGFFEERGVEVLFHDYLHPAFPQRFEDFVSHVSAIDLLFNCGPEAEDILRSRGKCLVHLREMDPRDPSSEQ